MKLCLPKYCCLVKERSNYTIQYKGVYLMTVYYCNYFPHWTDEYNIPVSLDTITKLIEKDKERL